MKKIFAVTFILAQTFLWTAPVHGSQTCDDLRRSYENACNTEQKMACDNLTNCQNFRNDCNAKLDSPSSCEVFQQCMNKHFNINFTANNDLRGYCGYSWTPSPDGSGSCKNQNRYFDPVGHSCPGFIKNFVDKFPDRDINCEGHKARFWTSHQSCQMAYQAYKAKVDGGECNRVAAPSSPNTCTAAWTSVVISDDSIEGIANKVVNGSRDIYGNFSNLIDYRQTYIQAADDNNVTAQ